jgi:hypothetical protein
MKYIHIIFLFLMLICITCSVDAASGKNKKTDEALTKLSQGTRKRILAMQQSGMNSDQIAEKVQYEVGGKNTARRMMEKINVEENKKNWNHHQKQRYQGKERVLANGAAAQRKRNRKRMKNEEL